MLGELPCNLDQAPQADVDGSLHSCPGALHLAKSHDGKSSPFVLYLELFFLQFSRTL